MPNSSLNEKFFRQKLYRISKHTLHVQKRFTKNQAIHDNVKKYATARQATRNKAHALCILDN